MKRITVLLADDHMIVREGIRNLLERDADLEVVGEAKEGREAVAMAKKLCPKRRADGYRHAEAQWFGGYPASAQSGCLASR